MAIRDILEDGEVPMPHDHEMARLLTKPNEHMSLVIPTLDQGVSDVVLTDTWGTQFYEKLARHGKFIGRIAELGYRPTARNFATLHKNIGKRAPHWFNGDRIRFNFEPNYEYSTPWYEIRNRWYEYGGSVGYVYQNIRANNLTYDGKNFGRKMTVWYASGSTHDATTEYYHTGANASPYYPAYMAFGANGEKIQPIKGGKTMSCLVLNINVAGGGVRYITTNMPHMDLIVSFSDGKKEWVSTDGAGIFETRNTSPRLMLTCSHAWASEFIRPSSWYDVAKMTNQYTSGMLTYITQPRYWRIVDLVVKNRGKDAVIEIQACGDDKLEVSIYDHAGKERIIDYYGRRAGDGANNRMSRVVKNRANTLFGIAINGVLDDSVFSNHRRINSDKYNRLIHWVWAQ